MARTSAGSERSGLADAVPEARSSAVGPLQAKAGGGGCVLRYLAMRTARVTRSRKKIGAGGFFVTDPDVVRRPHTKRNNGPGDQLGVPQLWLGSLLDSPDGSGRAVVWTRRARPAAA